MEETGACALHYTFPYISGPLDYVPEQQQWRLFQSAGRAGYDGAAYAD